MISDDDLLEGLHEPVITTALIRRLALRPDLKATVDRFDAANQGACSLRISFDRS